MTAPRIRPTRPDDADAVAALWTEAYVTLGVSGRTDPYGPADYFDSAGNGDLFAVDGPDRLAGVVALCGPQAERRIVAIGEEAELSRLAVAVPARQGGVGRALVEHCERQARAAGWSAIALWSRPLQVEAHRLYESLGYRRMRERGSVDASGRARLVFRLDLRPVERMAP